VGCACGFGSGASAEAGGAAGGLRVGLGLRCFGLFTQRENPWGGVVAWGDVSAGGGGESFRDSTWSGNTASKKPGLAVTFRHCKLSLST